MGSGSWNRERARAAAYAKAKPPSGAERRQDHALGEQLRDEAAAAGADREADADFALPVYRASQHQIGDVGARDQQHQCDHDHEDRHQPGHALPLAGNTAGLVQRKRLAPVVLAISLVDAGVDDIEGGHGLRRV